MEKIKASHNSGKTYLEVHLKKNDYYSENEKVTGLWKGNLCERLGLENKEVDNKDFSKLQQNINPVTDEKLTLRNVKGATRFYDFQCSSQKSVSVMSMFDGRLKKAHQEAVETAMRELEKFAAVKHNSADGKVRFDPSTTGNICYGVFHHDASRSLDPQLHTHCVVVNATFDENENRMKSLETLDMCRAVRYAGKVYQNQMARSAVELGYEIETKRSRKGEIEGFEIKGVSEEVRKKFSQRRGEIEAEIDRFKKEHGRSPEIREINAIVRRTRPDKLTEISTEEVKDLQLSRLSEDEREHLSRIAENAVLKAPGQSQTVPAHEVLEKAVSHVYERESVKEAHEILAEALNGDLGKVDLNDLKEEMTNRDLVRLDEERISLKGLYTDRKTVELERYALEFCENSKDSCQAFSHSFRPFSGKGGSYDDHRRAVSEVLSSRDRVIIFRGAAGAGKTTALSEIKKGMESGGCLNIHYAAPTNAAAEVLRNEGFTGAVSVSRFLAEAETGKRDLENSVIFVDEAGLQSNRQGAAVLKLAEDHNARIVFTGDSRQHKSVESGDFMRLIETYTGTAKVELARILRQRDEAYREAVSRLSRNETAAGLEILDKLGCVREGKSGYLKAAAGAYLEKSAVSDCVCVAPTHEECDRMTGFIREGLKEKGKLDNEVPRDSFRSFSWTERRKKNASCYEKGQYLVFTRKSGEFRKNECRKVTDIDKKNNTVTLDNNVRLDLSRSGVSLDVGEIRRIGLAPGDRILVTANDREHGLVNGDILDVTGVNESGHITAVSSSGNGKVITGDFKNIRYGYVTTSHKSQGRTASHVVAAAEKMSREAVYVSMSRGRDSCALFVPDREKFLKSHSPSKWTEERRAVRDLKTAAPLPSYDPIPGKRTYLARVMESPLVGRVRDVLINAKTKASRISREIFSVREREAEYKEKAVQREIAEEINKHLEKNRTKNREVERGRGYSR